MEKLNITKGKCKVKTNYKNPFSDDTIYRIAGNDGFSHSIKEMESNAELIADTFNTYNDTPILPSELLKQRNELLEVCFKAFYLCDKLQMPTESELKELKNELNTAMKNSNQK
jgi:hypothetical protein